MIIVAGSQTDTLRDAFKHLADARMKRRRANTAAETLDEIEWSNPGVVITDLEFEGIDGVQFVRRIRGIHEQKKEKLIGAALAGEKAEGFRSPEVSRHRVEKNEQARKRYSQVPILALLENATRERIADLLRAGVSDILLCPYDPAALRIRAARGQNANYASMLREVDPEETRDLPDEPDQDDLNELLLRKDALKDLYDPLIIVQKREASRRKAREQSSEGAKPLITYDFKHPARVSKDQTRTIENLHSNLARMMAASFSTFARQIVDCDIAFVDQTTYAEFIQSLSNPSVSYTYTIDPLGGAAILDFSTPVAYAFIERQFGGVGGRRPGARRPLTAIERTVMTSVAIRSFADLEATWAPLLEIGVSNPELETNPEFMQVAAPSDTVVLIAFEVNMPAASGLVNLCYPYFTIEPVMSLFNVQTWASRDTRRRKGRGHLQDRLDQLKTIDTEVTAFAGYGSLPADQLATLQEGDTIVLDTRVTDPGVVLVENIPTFYAHSGVSDTDNHAIEITRSIPPEEARKYSWHRERRAS